ncbi:hypothetical protein F2Q70_00039665 [Brassica cretica]|uniref:Uncharacterized protein n=1 Tax=Brassica cretica TaxID=69181 RepID=A0A8S9KD16_BRACR|nr:hypothetical protein F2Q70_00039665 [Brassica cretica]
MNGNGRCKFRPKSSGVAVEGEALRQTPAPDPRWTYLGRWSSPEPIIPVTPPSLVKETESDAPSASATDPHLATETTGTPPASAIIIISPQTTAFPSPATLAVTNTKSPPPPGSLTHELNVVAEVTLAPDDSVNVISEIEDSEAESDKDSEAESNKGIAFVRSIGAWPKPLRFTPPHTPSEPATPRLTISEAHQGIWKPSVSLGCPDESILEKPLSCGGTDLPTGWHSSGYGDGNIRFLAGN